MGIILVISSAQGAEQEIVPQPASEPTNSYESLAPKNLDKFCEKVKANDVYIKYSKVVAKYVKLGRVQTEFNNGQPIKGLLYFPAPTFENNSDNLLLQWYEKNPYVGLYRDSLYGVYSLKINVYGLDDYQNHATLTWNSSGGYREDDDIRFRFQTHKKLLDALTSCFDEIVTTDLAYVFMSPSDVGNVRKAYYEAKKNPQVLVREVTPSGDVVEKYVPNPAMGWYVIRRDDNILYSRPHWLTVVYGAEKVLNISGEEYLKKLREELEGDKSKRIMK
jgi:hypothetical protein